MKIAYIEDDVDSRTLFTHRLKSEGFQCDCFKTGEEFLKIAVPGGYDLLFIDIRLPDCDGIQLLRQLRKLKVFTPVILVTAFDTLEYARDALNSGANYLLEKPFTFTLLKKLIYKVVKSPQPLQDRVDRGLATFTLSEREAEVARLVLKGLANKEIANSLTISEKTVRQHITQIFEKAKVSSRGEFFSSIFPT